MSGTIFLDNRLRATKQVTFENQIISSFFYVFLWVSLLLFSALNYAWHNILTLRFKMYTYVLYIKVTIWSKRQLDSNLATSIMMGMCLIWLQARLHEFSSTRQHLNDKKIFFKELWLQLPFFFSSIRFNTSCYIQFIFQKDKNYRSNENRIKW